MLTVRYAILASVGLCVLLVSLQWAMREPGFAKRVTEKSSPAFLCACFSGCCSFGRKLMAMHIGREIQRVMEERGQTVVGLAREYGCSRIHMYRIFDKPSIDTAMLMRFSLLLRYDFFMLYQQEYDTRLLTEK